MTTQEFSSIDPKKAELGRPSEHNFKFLYGVGEVQNILNTNRDKLLRHFSRNYASLICQNDILRHSQSNEDFEFWLKNVDF